MTPFENILFAGKSFRARFLLSLRQSERVPMGFNPHPRMDKAFLVPHRRWNHGKSSDPRQTDRIVARHLKIRLRSLCSRRVITHESRLFRIKPHQRLEHLQAKWTPVCVKKML
jgi:hypothetical protein